MMERKTGTAEVRGEMEKLIFSKRLLERTEQMRRSPVSVLEAPAGYGKTTAVTWALEGAESAAWYTGV